MFKKVYIEITNNCNLNCSFCIGNYRKKEFLKIDKFKILLNKLKGYTKYLYFHVMGEPLLHPNINELIDLASDDFFVNITTNGYLIDRIRDNKNIRQINISLQSFEGKSGKSLNEYLDSVFEVVDNLVLHGTYVKYRLWVKNENADKILKKLEEKYEVNLLNIKNTKLKDNIYFEVEDEFIWPSYDNEYYNENGSCRGTRDHIGILVSGDVIPCCLDSAGIIKLGNIYNQDLNVIINSNLFKKIKQGFLDNKKIHDLCKKCNFYELRR